MGINKSAGLFITILIFLASSFTPASAEVFVHDDITAVSRPIKLTAVTKGKFLSEGGRLVTFSIDGKTLGTNLSGGDGYAYFSYTPESAGIFKLRAESGKDLDEGTLLVTTKSDRILVIETELVFEKFPFSLQLVKDSSGALKHLAKDYRIVYITTMAGVKTARKVLRDNSLPLSPIYKWQGVELLDDLKAKGITPHAIVASSGVISEAVDVANKYSFEETEAGTEAKDWNDLLKHLDTRGK